MTTTMDNADNLGEQSTTAQLTSTSAMRVSVLRSPSQSGEPFIRRDWFRRINPEWSDATDHAGNLLAEISDMHGRPELLSGSDQRFLTYVINQRIRTFQDGSRGVYLTDRQHDRLDCITKRYTQSHVAKRFLTVRSQLAKHGSLEAARANHDWTPDDWRAGLSG